MYFLVLFCEMIMQQGEQRSVFWCQSCNKVLVTLHAVHSLPSAYNTESRNEKRTCTSVPGGGERGLPLHRSGTRSPVTFISMHEARSNPGTVLALDAYCSSAMM